MRLAATAHTSRPWRIHELAPEFRVEDVWQLSWRGEQADFRRLVAMIASGDPAKSSSRAVRALMGLRMKLGGLLGWDGADTGVGSRVATLRDRLPADLRDSATPAFHELSFNSLYLLEDEFAAEIANRTVHAVLHIGRVPREAEAFGAQMAVLVKPNGLLGNAYMAAIRPFRHRIVYPRLLREWERAWQRRSRNGQR